MIVQSAPENDSPFVITMAEHMSLAGTFARAFGNDAFEAVEPREEMLYVAAHHDAGWADVDARGSVDAHTGLPYNLRDTPFETIIATSKASPDFNSRRHAYCGLLSSMHSWGLYNGRYGMSEHVLLDSVAAANRPAADRMLDGELARQAKLKATLAADPETAAWIEDDHLFQNYKQLQFFDTLALYFNCAHEGARGEGVFPSVPRNAREDVTVRVTPQGDGVYRVSPYPFAEDPLRVTFTGRYMAPATDRERVDLDAVPSGSQTVTLVSA